MINTPEEFVEFLKIHCAERIAKITDTTGMWSHEGGLKQAYQDIQQYISSFQKGDYRHG